MSSTELTTFPNSARALSSDIWIGARSMAPLVVAYVPFALVVGSVLALNGGVAVGMVGTVGIFGGSAHLATVQAVERGGVLLAIATGLVANARLLAYSADLARRWAHQPRWFRIIAAAMVIDPTWALAERLDEGCHDPAQQRRRFLAAGVTLGLGFTVTVLFGMLSAAQLSSGDTTVVAPLCLVALLGSGLQKALTRRVVVVAGITAWLTAGLPAGTGLVVSIMAGCIAAPLARETSST